MREPVTVGPDCPDVTVTMHESRSSILANDPPHRPQSYGVARGLGVKREVLNLPVVHDSHPAPTADPRLTDVAQIPATMPATMPTTAPAAQ
jgi:hypothetical protein